MHLLTALTDALRMAFGMFWEVLWPLVLGLHVQLKTLARGIMAAQQREIKAMRSWRKSWYGQSGATGMGH